MKFRIEVDCTPEEARAAMGLPDVTSLNEQMIGELSARMLTQLTNGWLADGALVVVERATRSGAVDWPPGYAAGKSRRYGEATFWYGWYGSGAEAGQAGQPRATVPESSLDAPDGAHEE